MKKLLLILLGALMTLPTFAQDFEYTFEYTYEGQTLKYTFLGGGSNHVIVSMKDEFISGDLEIPSRVMDPKGNIYWVSVVDKFWDCSGLTSVTIPDSVTKIWGNAFSGCSSLTEINVAPDNEWLSSIDGVLFNKDKTTLHCYPGGKSGDYIIPASVTTIAQGAFLGSIGLTSVTIPRSVTEIGDYAFYIFSELKTIYYDTENPICLNNTLIGGFTPDIYKNTTLFVPATAIEKFKQTYPWSRFSNIQAYDFASIDEIASDGGVSSVYDLAGRPVLNDASASDIKSLAPGVYIIRQGDTSKKIVVR